MHGHDIMIKQLQNDVFDIKRDIEYIKQHGGGGSSSIQEVIFVVKHNTTEIISAITSQQRRDGKINMFIEEGIGINETFTIFLRYLNVETETIEKEEKLKLNSIITNGETVNVIDNNLDCTELVGNITFNFTTTTTEQIITITSGKKILKIYQVDENNPTDPSRFELIDTIYQEDFRVLDKDDDDNIEGLFIDGRKFNESDEGVYSLPIALDENDKKISLYTDFTGLSNSFTFNNPSKTIGSFLAEIVGEDTPSLMSDNYENVYDIPAMNKYYQIVPDGVIFNQQYAIQSSYSLTNSSYTINNDKYAVVCVGNIDVSKKYMLAPMSYMKYLAINTNSSSSSNSYTQIPCLFRHINAHLLHIYDSTTGEIANNLLKETKGRKTNIVCEEVFSNDTRIKCLFNTGTDKMINDYYYILDKKVYGKNIYAIYSVNGNINMCKINAIEEVNKDTSIIDETEINSINASNDNISFYGCITKNFLKFNITLGSSNVAHIQDYILISVKNGDDVNKKSYHKTETNTYTFTSPSSGDLFKENTNITITINDDYAIVEKVEANVHIVFYGQLMNFQYNPIIIDELNNYKFYMFFNEDMNTSDKLTFKLTNSISMDDNTHTLIKIVNPELRVYAKYPEKTNYELILSQTMTETDMNNRYIVIDELEKDCWYGTKIYATLFYQMKEINLGVIRFINFGETKYEVVSKKVYCTVITSKATIVFKVATDVEEITIEKSKDELGNEYTDKILKIYQLNEFDLMGSTVSDNPRKKLVDIIQQKDFSTLDLVINESKTLYTSTNAYTSSNLADDKKVEFNPSLPREQRNTFNYSSNTRIYIKDDDTYKTFKFSSKKQNDDTYLLKTEKQYGTFIAELYDDKVKTNDYQFIPKNYNNQQNATNKYFAVLDCKRIAEDKITSDISTNSEIFYTYAYYHIGRININREYLLVSLPYLYFNSYWSPPRSEYKQLKQILIRNIDIFSLKIELNNMDTTTHSFIFSNADLSDSSNRNLFINGEKYCCKEIENGDEYIKQVVVNDEVPKWEYRSNNFRTIFKISNFIDKVGNKKDSSGKEVSNDAYKQFNITVYKNTEPDDNKYLNTAINDRTYSIIKLISMVDGSSAGVMYYPVYNEETEKYELEFKKEYPSSTSKYTGPMYINIDSETNGSAVVYKYTYVKPTNTTTT